MVIFSLRRGLPPTLDCTFKQSDSKEAQTDATAVRTGLSPSMGCGPGQGNLGTAITPDVLSYTPQVPTTHAEGFGAGLFPVHSPLLGESWLFSFPPLSDMLKFSG